MAKLEVKNSEFLLHTSYLKRGFTLIELLVTVVVLGLILTAMVGIFLTTIKAGKKADAIAEVKENGDYALGLMERMLRNAEEIITPCGGSKIEYRLPSDKDTDPKRVFQLSGTQIVSNDGTLTSRNLKVTSLTFSCVGDPVQTISISFTLTKGESTDVREFASVSFEGKVKVRKY